MKVNIRYFGMIAEKLHKTEEEIELHLDESVQAKAYFDERYPALKEMTYQVAVDQQLSEVIEPNQEINEIALLPPFAGG